MRKKSAKLYSREEAGGRVTGNLKRGDGEKIREAERGNIYREGGSHFCASDNNGPGLQKEKSTVRSSD
jgi:hypothetical protein